VTESYYAYMFGRPDDDGGHSPVRKALEDFVAYHSGAEHALGPILDAARDALAAVADSPSRPVADPSQADLRRDAVIASRYRAGESVDDLAADYRLTVEEISAILAPVSDPSETLALAKRIVEAADHHATEGTRITRVWPFALDSETLALIEKYRLSVDPTDEPGVWWVEAADWPRCTASGPTIGDAVRACVAKLKALDLSDRDP